MRALAVVVSFFVFATPAFGGVSLIVGKTVFKTKCGSCHTLAAAGTHATSTTPGPPLTNRKVSMAKVLFEIYGNGGAMPMMAANLTQAQINDVDRFPQRTKESKRPRTRSRSGTGSTPQLPEKLRP